MTEVVNQAVIEGPSRPRRIYAASSWRNPIQPMVVTALRNAGHEVYDFRHPEPGNEGFHWSEIDPVWQLWDAGEYRSALDHPIAKSGFAFDWSAMEWADTGVLILPSGRSAHLEAGYFVGAHKQLFILLDDNPTAELMYKMATRICLSVRELVAALDRRLVESTLG